MDGRIVAIRNASKRRMVNTRILAYAAKYASSFYVRIRDAVGSAGQLGTGGKHTYQMDPGNSTRRCAKWLFDISEGPTWS